MTNAYHAIIKSGSTFARGHTVYTSCEDIPVKIDGNFILDVEGEIRVAVLQSDLGPAAVPTLRNIESYYTTGCKIASSDAEYDVLMNVNGNTTPIKIKQNFGEIYYHGLFTVLSENRSKIVFWQYSDGKFIVDNEWCMENFSFLLNSSKLDFDDTCILASIPKGSEVRIDGHFYEVGKTVKMTLPGNYVYGTTGNFMITVGNNDLSFEYYYTEPLTDTEFEAEQILLRDISEGTKFEMPIHEFQKRCTAFRPKIDEPCRIWYLDTDRVVYNSSGCSPFMWRLEDAERINLLMEEKVRTLSPNNTNDDERISELERQHQEDQNTISKLYNERIRNRIAIAELNKRVTWKPEKRLVLIPRVDSDDLIKVRSKLHHIHLRRRCETEREKTSTIKYRELLNQIDSLLTEE